MKVLEKDMRNLHDKKDYFVIIEKLKPWIVINCLERDNYIITDNQAEKLAKIILKQAISLNVLEKVLKDIG